ncbi:MAG: hypothetical protein IPJ61_21705 [Tessaracoccus sp.]|nr:hypothetical protein [Tessaracoccus sp.]MBK7823606.1 hypothetical protein [Tessaracoccus sp.]
MAGRTHWGTYDAVAAAFPTYDVLAEAHPTYDESGFVPTADMEGDE